MKRPQGFENSASSLAARAESRTQAKDAQTGRGRPVAPQAKKTREVTRNSSEPSTSSRHGKTTGPLDVSPSEPEATTEPIPIVGSRARPVPSLTSSEPRQKSSGTRQKRAPFAASTSPRQPDTGAQAPDSPSVRAAARRRRRYERAEVKRFTRGARRRRLAWLIGIGSVVVVLGGSALISISPAMALRTIDVVGAQRVSAADIRTALDPQLGTPLPLLDNGEIKSELAKFSLIRSYSIQAEPPGTLVVRIVERTPLALLKAGSGYELVDQAGVVIQTTTDRPGGYPVVVLPDKATTASRNSEFAASAAVLAVLPAGTLSQVDSVSATGAQDVTLKLTSGVTVMWGGPEQPELKSSVLSDLLKSAPGASVYDVSAPNSPVTR